MVLVLVLVMLGVGVRVGPGVLLMLLLLLLLLLPSHLAIPGKQAPFLPACPCFCEAVLDAEVDRCASKAKLLKFGDNRCHLRWCRAVPSYPKGLFVFPISASKRPLRDNSPTTVLIASSSFQQCSHVMRLAISLQNSSDYSDPCP